MDKLGAAQGRFHMIHWGHMEYLLECKKKCEFLYIGISDCDPSNSYFHQEYTESGSNDLYRSIKHPIYTFTYFERARMIAESLILEGVPQSEFMVVPFPVHFPHLLKYYVPQQAVVYITIYDEWGEQKPGLFESLGYKTDVLWRRSMQERFTTATEVRRRIASGEDFRDLIPEGAYKVIEEFGLKDALMKCDAE